MKWKGLSSPSRCTYMLLHRASTDCQTESAAAASNTCLTRAGFVHAVELIEDMG